MKKYKLYKNKQKKNILPKTNFIASGRDVKYNTKLFWSLWISKMILKGGADKLTDEFPIIILDNLMTLAIGANLCVGYIDILRKINSSEKIRKLIEVLNEKGIDIDFAKMDFDLKTNIFDEEAGVCVFDEGKSIYYLNNNTYTYTDKDKSVDITEAVNKALLSKRKYKKYEKSKQNK